MDNVSFKIVFKESCAGKPLQQIIEELINETIKKAVDECIDKRSKREN